MSDKESAESMGAVKEALSKTSFKEEPSTLFEEAEKLWNEEKDRFEEESRLRKESDWTRLVEQGVESRPKL